MSDLTDIRCTPSIIQNTRVLAKLPDYEYNITFRITASLQNYRYRSRNSTNSMKTDIKTQLS